MEKKPVLKKKTKFGYSVLSEKNPEKNLGQILEKSHKAEKCKKGALGLLKIQFDAKNQNRRGTLSEKKMKNENLEQSHSVKKCKRGPLGIF